MIPRDISRLCPPYTIPPEYILCYNRNRSSFNHTAVLLSFYVGLLLMPSSLVCYRLISSFLVITRFNPPDIVFYFCFCFCFGKFICRLTDYQELCYTQFATTECSCTSWNFPVSFGTGIFLFRSWTYWRCHVENVSGLIDTAVIPIYIPLCSFSIYW